MLIENRQVIAAPRSQLWDFLLEIEQVGECIPGVAGVRLVGPEEYEATMRLKVGPIDLKFEAMLHVLERDRAHWTAKLRAEGTERGIGGAVNATFTMTLEELNPGSTELFVRTEAKILGKLGEFGQPVMKKKAAAITEQFAKTVGERVARGDGVAAGSQKRA
jgi:carbon monoxide dehydrogenase subunit G